jgi:hypothetical protein
MTDSNAGMTEVFKSTVANQMRAALAMLADAIEQCPDGAWDRPVANLKFCQAAFHVLFYTDLYLEPSIAKFREQSFHIEHAEFFAGYEELEPRAPARTYDKSSLLRYLEHCREKIGRSLAKETAESLAGPSGFDRLTFSRAELYLYNLRHLQHHAAQLMLRLRLDYDSDFRWVRSG